MILYSILFLLLIYLFLKTGKTTKKMKTIFKRTDNEIDNVLINSFPNNILVIGKDGDIKDKSTIANINADTTEITGNLNLSRGEINVDKICSFTDPTVCINLDSDINFIAGNNKFNLKNNDIEHLININKNWSSVMARDWNDKKAKLNDRFFTFENVYDEKGGEIERQFKDNSGSIARYYFKTDSKDIPETSRYRYKSHLYQIKLFDHLPLSN